MALLQATYPVAPKGLATNYEETALPPDFALKFKNRFINSAGGAEKRRGIAQLGSTITGSPTITSLHEFVNSRTGASTLLAAGGGWIFRYDGSAAWVTAHDSGYRGDVQYQSAQMVSRLIFVNGTSRNVYTDDGTNFNELYPIITEGNSTGVTSAQGLYDTATSSYGFHQMGVSQGDILHNITRGSFAFILGVSAAFPGVTVSADATAASPVLNTQGGITHTPITGQTAGDRYRILDAVELNILPTGGSDDNIGTMTVGSSAAEVFVSGMNWPGSTLRLGDFIYSSTRNSLYHVTAISSSNLRVGSYNASGLANSGDSFTLHKLAMPIADKVHVHYGRAYFVDSREKHLIRVSGPDDPTDMTTSFGTLDSHTFSFGSQQPTGDTIKALTSYQRFLVMTGSRFTLLFEGTDPIRDEESNAKDFSPIGLFPQGCKSGNGLASIGNDVVIVSDDGVQSFAMRNDASTLGQENLSEALKNSLRTLLASTSPEEVFAFHYPRRSWVCFKIGSSIYVYNYAPYFGQGATSPTLAFGQVEAPSRGSWSLFDGLFAQQKCFHVRQDGTLTCAGAGGKVYTFDTTDVYADAGQTYSTEYQSGWLTLDEPRRDLRVKQGHYIQPTFNSGSGVTYTVRAEAPFNVESTDQIQITTSGGAQIGTATIGSWVIGASPIFDVKYPLRWRGKEVRVSFTTSDTNGPDVISRFTLYINRFGLR